MKILQLPKNYIFGGDDYSFYKNLIVPVVNGWVFNIFKLKKDTVHYYSQKPICYFLNLNGGKVIEDNYLIIKEFNCIVIRNFTEEGMDTGGTNPKFRITPDGNIQDYGQWSHEEKDFKNKDYCCFVANPYNEDKEKSDYQEEYSDNHPIDYAKTLLILAGIYSKTKSFLLIRNKQDNRAISFESPLKDPLEGICASQDGLTFLAMSKTEAAIIDNPLL